MPGPTVLCFRMEPQRQTRLAFVCAGLGIALKEPPEGEWGQTLGALWGLDRPERRPGPAGLPPEEMIVFCGLTEAQLDAFLARWRQTGLPPIRLKAVLTPTNRGWTPAMLQAQLSEEAAAFRRRKG